MAQSRQDRSNWPPREMLRRARRLLELAYSRVKHMNEQCRLSASFRDPSGYVFRRNGVIYRAVLPRYRRQYEHLMSSGLYEDLVERGLLVEHEQVDVEVPGAFVVLRPRQVQFVSYPHEWCFSQLKDAALATLRIARRALRYGMVLKDASAYNIQFLDCRPCLIDTL